MLVFMTHNTDFGDAFERGRATTTDTSISSPPPVRRRVSMSSSTR